MKMEHKMSKDCWCNPVVKSYKISKKQSDILEFIREFHKLHCYSPSLNEIGQKFSISNPTVWQHLQALIKKEYIIKPKNSKRDIILI